MENEHVEPDRRVSESNDQPARDWATRGVSWLGKCGGLAAGYSARAAEKAGSMFAAVGRVTVQALERSGGAKEVLFVRTSDLVKTKRAPAGEHRLREHLRLLQRDLTRLLRKKEAEVLALLRGKDDARRGKGEVERVEDAIRQHEQEIARLSEELNTSSIESTDGRHTVIEPVGAPTMDIVPVRAVEQVIAEEPLTRESMTEDSQGGAVLPALEVPEQAKSGDRFGVVEHVQPPTPVEQPEPAEEVVSSHEQVSAAPIQESRGVDQAPSPRPNRLSMEEIAQQAEFALASERMTFLGVIRGVETAGHLSESAAKKLNAIENPAVDQLFALLAEHPHEATRARSLGALTERQAREALPVFKQAATDASARVRAAAMSGLYKLVGEKAIPYLTRALRDTDATVRHRAVTCLAWTGSRDVAPKLHELMKDDDASVRRAVVSALGTLKSQVSVPGVIEALEDEDVKVREAAHRTLKELSRRNIMFNANGPLEERDRAKARWKAWWKEQGSRAEDL